MKVLVICAGRLGLGLQPSSSTPPFYPSMSSIQRPTVVFKTPSRD